MGFLMFVLAGLVFVALVVRSAPMPVAESAPMAPVPSLLTPPKPALEKPRRPLPGISAGWHALERLQGRKRGPCVYVFAFRSTSGDIIWKVGQTTNLNSRYGEHRDLWRGGYVHGIHATGPINIVRVYNCKSRHTARVLEQAFHDALGERDGEFWRNLEFEFPSMDTPYASLLKFLGVPAVSASRIESKSCAICGSGTVESCDLGETISGLPWQDYHCNVCHTEEAS